MYFKTIDLKEKDQKSDFQIKFLFQTSRSSVRFGCFAGREEAVGVPRGVEEHQRDQRQTRHPQQDPSWILAGGGRERTEPSFGGKRHRTSRLEPTIDGEIRFSGSFENPDWRMAEQVDCVQEGDGESGGGQVQERGGRIQGSAGPVL